MNENAIMNHYFNNGSYSLSILPSSIPGAGLGVFADEFIPKGSIIGEYVGSPIDTDGDYTYVKNNGKVIDASAYPRCFVAMLNDSIGSTYFYNCEFTEDAQHRIFALATENIPEGNELFVSYGSDYWLLSYKGDYETALRNTIWKLTIRKNDCELLKQRSLFNVVCGNDA